MKQIQNATSIPPELSTLAKCEETVRRNIDYFLEAGRALMVIRDNFKAWGLKDEHGTFETYCRAKWSMSRIHAHRMIEAVETVEMLPIGNKPSNEGQARALAAAPPEKRADIWREAVETAPDGKLTAKHIKEVINKATGEVIDPEDLEVVKEERKQMGKSRGSFDDTHAMLEGFRQIQETLKGMSQLKPKASMVGAVMEAARDIVSCANNLIRSIERTL